MTEYIGNGMAQEKVDYIIFWVHNYIFLLKRLKSGKSF